MWATSPNRQHTHAASVSIYLIRSTRVMRNCWCVNQSTMQCLKSEIAFGSFNPNIQKPVC